MSLYPKSKLFIDSYNRHVNSSVHFQTVDLPTGPDDEMQIPSVILVPQRKQRVATSVQEQYHEISKIGGGNHNNNIDVSSSKPWKVDMARKSDSSRRFRRPSRIRRGASIAEETVSPSYFHNACTNKRSSFGGSRNNKYDHEGYPSDEENGFGSSTTSPGSDGRNSPNTSGELSSGGYGRYVTGACFDRV